MTAGLTMEKARGSMKESLWILLVLIAVLVVFLVLMAIVAIIGTWIGHLHINLYPGGRVVAARS